MRERRARTSRRPPAAGGVDGVAHQVGEHLADLAGEAEQVQLRVVVALHVHIEGVEAALVETQHRIEQLRHFGARRAVDCR